MSFDYPRRIYFACERCAKCCGDTEQRIRSVFLLNTEAERIARETIKDIVEFAEKIEGFEPYAYLIRKTDEGKCVFLRNDTCMIYRIRPLVCRFYPFELNRTEDRYVFVHTDECPSIGKGPRVKKEYFRRLLDMAVAVMKQDAEARKRLAKMDVKKKHNE